MSEQAEPRPKMGQLLAYSDVTVGSAVWTKLWRMFRAAQASLWDKFQSQSLQVAELGSGLQPMSFSTWRSRGLVQRACWECRQHRESGAPISWEQEGAAWTKRVSQAGSLMCPPSLWCKSLCQLISLRILSKSWDFSSQKCRTPTEMSQTTISSPRKTSL